MVTTKKAQMTHKWLLIAPSLGPKGPIEGMHASPRPPGGRDDLHNAIDGKFFHFLDKFLCQSWLAQLILQFDSQLGVLSLYIGLTLCFAPRGGAYPAVEGRPLSSVHYQLNSRRSLDFLSSIF